MILVLDCGHSRLAWGFAGDHGWAAQGTVSNQDIGTLALRNWQNLQRPMRVVGVNVAGEAMRVRVEAQLTRWRMMPQWLIATEAACGVSNRYALPSQLGADRWAALIAARTLVAQELFPRRASSSMCARRSPWTRSTPRVCFGAASFCRD